MGVFALALVDLALDFKMIQRFLILGMIATLAACGVDGAPKPPPPKPAQSTGVSISGDARVGVVYGG